LEYNQDEQNGLIIWGNPLLIPNQNYAIQTADARDGGTFTVALDDELFHPHRGTTLLSDLATFQTVSHYRMASSLGGTILTAATPPASIKPARLKRGDPVNPLDPELHSSPGPISRNLYYQLHTGLFGTRGNTP
jgi:hypothetical protein